MSNTAVKVMEVVVGGKQLPMENPAQVSWLCMAAREQEDPESQVGAKKLPINPHIIDSFIPNSMHYTNLLTIMGLYI